MSAHILNLKYLSRFFENLENFLFCESCNCIIFSRDIELFDYSGLCYSCLIAEEEEIFAYESQVDDEPDYSYYEYEDEAPDCPYCGKEMGFDTDDLGGGEFYCNCHIEFCEVCSKTLKHDGYDRDYPHICRECEQDREDERVLAWESRMERMYDE